MWHTRPDQTDSNTSFNSLAADEQLVLGFRCRRPLPGIGFGVTVKSALRFNSHFEGSLVTSLAAQWVSHINRDVLRRGEVHVKLEVMNLLSGCTIPNFEFILCVPHNGTDEIKVFKISELDGSQGHHGMTHLIENGQYLLKLEEKLLLDKDDSDKYDFDLVLSTLDRLPSALVKNVRPIISEKKPSVVNKSFKEMFPHIYQSMLRLLRDPGSVNVAFVFAIHSCQRKVALWANHTLLDKYPRFQELFDIADNRPMQIPIEGISLTTFCVLLKYLYTEDLDLNIDPSQYLMCDMERLKDESSMDSTSTLAVLNKSLREHNTAQFYATWNVKDKVSWSDLFLAADRFEIAELRKQCLVNLLASVDESNAMEILFGVGTRFRDIREYVMKYISEHLDDIFSIRTEDPFKRFSNHEGCHEVMLELLRLQSRSRVRLRE